VAPHVDILRSRDLGSRWAAKLPTSHDLRRLLVQIAGQYRALADQLELIDKLYAPKRPLE
jgi:hypothetical protein